MGITPPQNRPEPGPKSRRNRMQTNIIIPPTPTDLMQYLQPRVRLGAARGAVRHMRRELHSARRRYAGGTVAEAGSLRAIVSSTRLECRREFLGRQGRRIDLLGLLGQKRRDGSPVWALVCPLHPICADNGGVKQTPTALEYRLPCGDKYTPITAPYALTRRSNPVSVASESDETSLLRAPSGIPALPRHVRRMLADPKILRRAARIAVLYQPESWQVRKPDPALVVEWIDRPGEWYALAVWGGDAPRIMEFVS